MYRNTDSATMEWLLGKKAIDSLINESKSVSYRAVTLKSKEIDPEGVGIHVKSIFTNEQLHDYFSTHCYNRHSKGSRATKMSLDQANNIYKLVKERRDLERIRRRYMKLSKSELVELLIHFEQYNTQNKS
ncbi:hypothetical protein [Gorillibacterium massiliense]|uniref:hypothetical protein n=1 Tax=Gorillibacterium massiliense TaxID=1280390 RepID=UPI000694AC6D|nr:hypothetical protein [Gorillibacterium massiliense]